MSKKSTSADTVLVHRRREAPEDHLCTCGKLRETCVQECVRAIWR